MQRFSRPKLMKSNRIWQVESLGLSIKKNVGRFLKSCFVFVGRLEPPACRIGLRAFVQPHKTSIGPPLLQRGQSPQIGCGDCLQQGYSRGVVTSGWLDPLRLSLDGLVSNRFGHSRQRCHLAAFKEAPHEAPRHGLLVHGKRAS